MEDTGAFAEVTKMNGATAIERSNDRSELELVGRVRKVGQSGGRSDALRGAIEAEEALEVQDTPYALSKSAVSFLKHVLPNATPAEQLFRQADTAHIVEALLLARGPIRVKGTNSLNYREGLEALMSPGSSFAGVAEDVFGNSTNAAYMSLLHFAKKCRSAFGEGATIEDLIHLSDASYDVEYIEKPVEELRVERQRNIGRQGIVRSTAHRKASSVSVAPTLPTTTRTSTPDDWFSAPIEDKQVSTKTGVNNPYQYADKETPTPRDTEDIQPLSWQRDALCSQTDPEAFFPEKGGSTRDAKKICVSCDVRDECLNYALANDERFGIWGGLSERERRKLRKTSA